MSQWLVTSFKLHVTWGSKFLKVLIRSSVILNKWINLFETGANVQRRDDKTLYSGPGSGEVEWGGRLHIWASGISETPCQRAQSSEGSEWFYYLMQWKQIVVLKGIFIRQTLRTFLSFKSYNKEILVCNINHLVMSSQLFLHNLLQFGSSFLGGREGRKLDPRKMFLQTCQDGEAFDLKTDE